MDIETEKKVTGVKTIAIWERKIKEKLLYGENIELNAEKIRILKRVTLYIQFSGLHLFSCC